MNETVPVSLEELLGHRPWVRRVARALVPDWQTLEQEVWATAMERRPDRGGSVRGWFRTVLRRKAMNLARGEKRLRERERRVARPEASGHEAVASIDAHRDVVDAVLRLAEPGRTAILLKFWEDLGPAEIAERTGVPVETVRTRIRRGVARLRDDLDERGGGDGRSWMVALLPLLGSGSSLPLPATAGVLLVTLKTKLILTVVLLLAAILGWSVVNGSAPVEDPAPPAPREPELVAGADAPPPPAVEEPPAVPAAPPAEPGSLAVTVRDDRGLPVEGATVFLLSPKVAGLNEPGPKTGSVRTSGAGAGRIDGLTGRFTAGVRAAGFRIAYRELDFDTAGGRDVAWEIRLEPWPVQNRIEGQVVDAKTGEPIRGAKLRYRTAAERAFYLPAPGRPLRDQGGAEADEEGRFSIERLAPGRYLVVGFTTGYVDEDPGRATEMPRSNLEVRLQPLPLLEVKCVPWRPEAGAGIVVEFEPASGAGAGGAARPQPSEVKEGVFTVGERTPIYPGTYRVTATVPE